MASSRRAKISALRGLINPVTNGLPCVRGIKVSMSRSTTMLMALAPPAASVPPARVIATSDHGGHPRCAKTIVGTVVTNSNSMIRGLVSAT